MINKRKRYNYLIVLFFCVYFILGLFLVGNYGISTDEPNERMTMYINLNYITSLLGKKITGIPDLKSYVDRYYGIFLQLPTAVFEIGHRENFTYIYTGRHLYTFLICFISYGLFFFLCKKVFRSNMTALLGTVMIAFYPRFFAEQFYNIKDMFFVAAFILSMWATVMLIENKFSVKWLVVFVLATAITTNVRIVGILFLLLLVGYVWMAYALEKICAVNYYDFSLKKVLFITVVALGLYFVFLVVLYPVAWESPVATIIEMFTKFSNYDDWTGAVIFMGKSLTMDTIPWYYVPLWMLISTPIWYILIFSLTVILIIGNLVLRKRKNLLLKIVFEYKYLTWTILLAVVPWLVILIKKANLYNGWRHCYFLVPPLVVFVLYGVDLAFRKGVKWQKTTIALIITIGLLNQFRWICVNHPFEMVYFNEVGKKWGAEFDRDYWHLSNLQACRYILENDDSEKITLQTSGHQFFMYMLNEEEKARIEISDNPMYYIETYRGKIGNEFAIEGYEEFYSFKVDNFKVVTIYKRIN